MDRSKKLLKDQVLEYVGNLRLDEDDYDYDRDRQREGVRRMPSMDSLSLTQRRHSLAVADAMHGYQS